MPDYNQINQLGKKKLSKVAWLILICLVAILFAVSLFFRQKFFGLDRSHSVYQAVFLTNGQVYFGTLSNQNQNYVVLKNIYYLQAAQSLQGTNQQSQPFSLVKLGKELHGPTDIMYINHSQILFYEDLKPDSNVVKTIESYRSTESPN